MVLITPAGIGRPIDEAALNKALFDKEDVEVIGVVMNKVLPDRMESIADIARRGFERLGLELVGMIPRSACWPSPRLDQICDKIRGEFLHGKNRGRKRIDKAVIGAVSSANIFRGVENDALLIVPGDREDVILAAAHALHGGRWRALLRHRDVGRPCGRVDGFWK